MSHTVLVVNNETLEKMKNHYGVPPKLPAGAVFAAKADGCSVTGYRSGKVLFQGKNAESESSKWAGETAAPKKKSVPNAVLPDGFASMSVIGSDEVGTGDYFGPITVVAAYVEKSRISELKALGVRDSKDMKDPEIISVAKKLLKDIPYSLLILRNEKYNELQESGMSQGKIKAILHNQALFKLHEKIAPELPEAVLIDQFAEKAIYYRHLNGQNVIVRDNVFFSTKGESIHIAVAAASILARYAFLKEMDKLSEEAGFPIPKGAGQLVDEAAARLIKTYDESILRHFTKLHFANTGKAKSIARSK
ncbi:ribonuclease HIII [Domibacillus epiphyticus]|uniref:Ribonuclease HIII n=1 Tax=Domibacillus epiphyticus TaxID=1714355 RepID=A0A1V2A9F7_9BACI|nr:ribonuclease HIII [Domibacillus epiphyticus]OMP67492.1 ribonuclease HIII [Domibacillus epiphyticus]